MTDAKAAVAASPKTTDLVSLVDQALADVPRRPFYHDAGDTLAGAVGRSMPSANALRRLLIELEVKPGARILHVGTGSGYAAAVLSRIAVKVFTVERVRELAELARARFAALGYENIVVREGNGFEGLADEAPFDAVLVSARGPSDLQALKRQLGIGGVLVGTRGKDRHRQTLYKLRRVNVQSCTKEDRGELDVAADVGDILIALGSASEDAVKIARDHARKTGARLEDELRSISVSDETDLYRALALDRGMRFSSADALLNEMDPRAFESIPKAFLRHSRFAPLRLEGEVAYIATSDPDVAAAEIKKALRTRHVNVCLVKPADLRRLWTSLDLAAYKQDGGNSKPVSETEGAELLQAVDDSLDNHYVELLDSMFFDAIAQRASDLHLERYSDQVVARIRVDGDLRELNGYRLTAEELVRLINVIKVKSNLDISERRLPQGGRTSVVAGGKKYDLRVQTQPCLYGEHAVIRFLPQESRLLGIEELGFSPEIAARYRRLLAHPAGLVLVVGPTGSGKSTTLYAGLGELAADKTRKVITVEDPIEYAVNGVQQAQVRPEVGFHFADAMRAFVREDPDVILVGEIRDKETALEAIRASQTGHLVLSTLHCNDAVDAIQRLFDLGMHPNSIASELLAIVAQQLAKRLCVRCRIAAAPEPEIVAEVFPDGVPEGFRCFSAPGCSHCNGAGTYGRVAVVEFLQVTSAVRSSIARQLPLDELRQSALGAGLMTMRDSALRHVNAGIIGLAELPHLLAAERLRPER